MAPRGDDWMRPKVVEQRYRSEIDRLLDEYFGLPTSFGLGEITARLVEWGQVSRVFQRYAERAASSMVTGVAAHNLKNWREAAKKSSRGPLIYRLLHAEMTGPVGSVMRRKIDENALLIRSLPSALAREANGLIAENQMAGLRSGSIVKILRAKMPELKATQIERIARTETAKAETAITQARSQHMGLDWYEWDTSEDARVRASHRLMDRVLVRFSDPPSPEALLGIKSTLGRYNAGECPYCRCGAYPLVALNEVRWPHNVYYGNRITVMSKPQFLDIAPGYRLAA